MLYGRDGKKRSIIKNNLNPSAKLFLTCILNLRGLIFLLMVRKLPSCFTSVEQDFLRLTTWIGLFGTSEFGHLLVSITSQKTLAVTKWIKSAGFLWSASPNMIMSMKLFDILELQPNFLDQQLFCIMKGRGEQVIHYLFT